MKENLETNIKEDISNILKKELKILLDIEKYPSVLNYVTRKISETIENYMASNEAKESFKICLYTKNHNPVGDSVKPGEIYEVINIEPFTEGEIILGKRYDLENKNKMASVAKGEKEQFPEIITLCGSTKFKKEYLEIMKKLTLEGKIVIPVGLWAHSGDTIIEEQKRMLDELHLRKIDLADSIFVINKGGYAGESTKKEIEYALRKGKQVRYLE